MKSHTLTIMLTISCFAFSTLSLHLLLIVSLSCVRFIWECPFMSFPQEALYSLHIAMNWEDIFTGFDWSEEPVPLPLYLYSSNGNKLNPIQSYLLDFWRFHATFVFPEFFHCKWSLLLKWCEVVVEKKVILVKQTTKDIIFLGVK